MKLEIDEKQRQLLLRIVETAQYRGNIEELKELMAEVDKLKTILTEAK